MKKFLMVLLSIAFVLNLTIVIGLIGGYGSPRRALYTITDELLSCSGNSLSDRLRCVTPAGQ